MSSRDFWAAFPRKLRYLGCVLRGRHVPDYAADWCVHCHLTGCALAVGFGAEDVS